MRRGSVALVPLFLAIMVLFWGMWTLGIGNDTLHQVNELENLRNIQKRLLVSSMKNYVNSIEEYTLENNIDVANASEMQEASLAAERISNLLVKSAMLRNKVDTIETATGAKGGSNLKDGNDNKMSNDKTKQNNNKMGNS